MSQYCSNCGHELKENADVCFSCGKIVNKDRLVAKEKVVSNETQEGQAVATLSVVFGSLGFFPLIFIGSLAGFILALVGIYTGEKNYAGRSKIGLGLSIGSFAFWIL